MKAPERMQADRMRLLKHLYEATNADIFASELLSVLAKDVGLVEDEATSIATYLVQKGLAKWRSIAGDLCITQPGIDEVEAVLVNTNHSTTGNDGSDEFRRSLAPMDERTTELLTLAQHIITAIEERTVPLSQIALRARRLAQILDDDAAIMWLTLECSGFTHPFQPERPWKSAEEAARGMEKSKKLRAVPDFLSMTALQEAARVASGKLPERTKLMGASLSELELLLSASPSKEDIKAVAQGPRGLDSATMLSAMQSERRAVLNRIANALHEWATGISVAHRFRLLAGSIFQRFKSSADATLADICPSALGKLDHAIERASTDNPEAWSAAAMSCRRVLKDFADAVYPAKEEKVQGHAVTDDKYINRLYAFAKERGGTLLALEELSALGSALDHIYELESKGVHAKISKEETDVVIVRTYILLSQLARLVRPTG